MTSNKFCKDCKWFKEVGNNIEVNISYHKCSSPLRPINIITGNHEITFCTTTRDASNAINNTIYCGEPGYWFESK